MTKQGNKDEGRGNRFLSGRSLLVVTCSWLLLPLLLGCKPKQKETSTSEKLKSLETKTEKAIEVAKEKIETLEQRFDRERTEYRERFHNMHLKLQARIGELKRRAEVDAAKRPELERAIQRLEQRSQVLRDRLQHIQSVSAKDWDQLKAPWQKKEGNDDYEDEILKETSM